MYSQSHLKRILPRKDEHYRPEFPSHYYSSSSVYSYSPTSSSDCPEHGARSHRRTKIILTISVIFATLGVLSIAGVAAYLGFLSKSINNGSQYEESYLFSTAINRRLPPMSEETELLQGPNGRSRSDLYLDDPLDLHNRLDETSHSLDTEIDEDTDLNTKLIFHPQRNTSSIFRHQFSQFEPLPTVLPSPVTVSSQKMTPPTPVDLQSPVILLGPKKNKSQNQYGSQSTTSRPNGPITVHFGTANSGQFLVTTPKDQIEQAQNPYKTSHVTLHSAVSGILPDETTTVRHKTLSTKLVIGSVEVPLRDPTHAPNNVVNRVGLPAETHKGYFPSTEISIQPLENSNQGFFPVNPFYKPTNQNHPEDLVSNHRVHLTFDRISPEFYDEKPWTPLLIRPSQIMNLDKRPRIEDTILSTEVPVSSSIDPQGVTVPDSEEMYYAYGETGDGDDVQSPGLLSTESPDVVSSESPTEVVSSESHREHTKLHETDENVDSGVNIGHSLGTIDYSRGNSDKEETPEKFEINENISTTPALSVEHGEQREQIPVYEISIPHIPNLVNYSIIPTGEILSMLTTGKENRIAITGIDSDLDLDPQIGHNADAVDGDYEDDIGEEDEEQNEKSPETKIYSLDPTNTDMVPMSIEIGPKNLLEVTTDMQEVVRTNVTSPVLPQYEPVLPNHTVHEVDPQQQQMKSTTDFILSTLGNLNLVKTSGPGDIFPDMTQNSSSSDPLFPPTRSYVSINLPLRPKPTESETDESEVSSEEKISLLADPEKKLRLVNGDGVPLAPDITTTSSLNKVLSMMMNFDESDPDGNNGVINLLKNNVELILANRSLGNSQGTNNKTRDREHKSFTRDPKIDSRFREPEKLQIPVPLIPGTASSSTNQKSGFKNSSVNKSWVPTKMTSLTINRHNSPVYKFILRKGQSVEELLKEIFHNYTEKGIGAGGNQTNGVSKVQNQVENREETSANQVIEGATNIKILTNQDQQSSTIPSIVTTLATVMSSTTTAQSSTNDPTSSTMDSMFRTSTSVIVNEESQTTSLPNATFKCSSTGVILSGFARCNSIKECRDNSDEMNCKCVDHLKSQLLHRKICDGIVDCADSTDEGYCDWCSPDQYICSGSRACVPREKICDSRRDCPRGDDESNCVKIGPGGQTDELEDISPIYHQSGYLMVRKKGIWGKLCVESFSSVLAHWEIKDLARAVCKAKTFSDFETVEKVIDEEDNSHEPYYELYNGSNETESEERLYASDESSPRSVIGFKISKCKTRMVVKVRCQDLQCGTAPRAFTQAARYRGRRIVGGSNAFPGEWPWQAALYRDGEYQCGATLISGRWLLSAGHCFYHAQDDYWVARLGTLRRGATILSPYEQVIKITHIFLHPQYKDIGFVNDVSLLRLEKEVNFTDFVRPVCLPEKDTQIRDGRICTVVGWGQLFETGRVFPDTLQEVQLPLISTAECRKRTLFLPLYKLTDEMFCAGFDRGGRDACLGDSGGPLMCPESDGRWSLYGVTSNGYGCARANRPGVYTKTKSYLDWVYEKMSQDSSFNHRDKSKPCPGHRCLLGECLEPRSVCNGIADCVDSSDEKNCTWS